MIGANDQGVYGVSTPHLGRAVDLLLSELGLVRLTPIVVLGLVGAGLYQINVKIPNVPAGDQPIVARVNGIETQANAFITVGP